MSTDHEDQDARSWEERLLSSAGEVARTGDRWFVSMARDVAGVGKWARREADVIGESMSAALETTVKVAKRMKPALPIEPSPGPEVPVEASSGPTPQIDLLVSAPASRVEDSELASHPAGITPLLSALREVVVSRSEDGYESLEDDPRFWALLDLIHGLAARPETPPSTEDAEKKGND